jgi:hypothetical protein
MSNGTTKPKPRPRSVEEWREKRKNRYGNDGRNGGFSILPRRVLDSDAFNELTKSAKLVLILSLDQLDYWYKKKYKGEFKRLSTVGPVAQRRKIFFAQQSTQRTRDHKLGYHRENQTRACGGRILADRGNRYASTVRYIQMVR